MSIGVSNMGIAEFVTVECFLNNKKIIVSCVYRMPGGDIEDFTNCLENMFYNMKCDMYFCGDFNIDLIKYSEHKNTRCFLDSLFANGFYPLINKPTRITESTATLIDNIFTNQFSVETDNGLLVSDVSDHLPVFTICRYKLKKKNINNFRYVRELGENNLFKLKSSLDQEKWDDVFVNQD